MFHADDIGIFEINELSLGLYIKGRRVHSKNSTESPRSLDRWFNELEGDNVEKVK